MHAEPAPLEHADSPPYRIPDDEDDAVAEFHATLPPPRNGPWFDPALPLEGMDCMA